MIAALMILALLVLACGFVFWALFDQSGMDDLHPDDENQGRGARHD